MVYSIVSNAGLISMLMLVCILKSIYSNVQKLETTLNIFIQFNTGNKQKVRVFKINYDKCSVSAIFSIQSSRFCTISRSLFWLLSRFAILIMLTPLYKRSGFPWDLSYPFKQVFRRHTDGFETNTDHQHLHTLVESMRD